MAYKSVIESEPVIGQEEVEINLTIQPRSALSCGHINVEVSLSEGV